MAIIQFPVGLLLSLRNSKVYSTDLSVSDDVVMEQLVSVKKRGTAIPSARRLSTKNNSTGRNITINVIYDIASFQVHELPRKDYIIQISTTVALITKHHAQTFNI